MAGEPVLFDYFATPIPEWRTIHIPQSFINYTAPVAKGLRFDLGGLSQSHMGYEVIWRLRWLQQ